MDSKRQADVHGREVIEDAFLKLVRFYVSNTPIKKGRHRIVAATMRLCSEVPRRSIIKSTHGWPLDITFTRTANAPTYFFGEYEPQLSAIVSRLVRSGDTCIDVGANFGWYTVLFSHICGPSGAVHSFEPVPNTFQQLSANIDLLGADSNVHVNAGALGDREGEITINTFDELGPGFSSISNFGRDDAIPVQCCITTLDTYTVEKVCEEVAFIKVDIEGAEMMFFQGAKSLFAQKRPPMMLIEMSPILSAAFGYKPNDLLSLIDGSADYRFYVADEVNGTMKRFNRFGSEVNGAYVFCLPTGHFEDRVDAIRDRMM